MKKSSKVLFQFFLQRKMQVAEKFTFLKVYADSISELAKWDEKLARELCRKIVQYWIYWNDEKSDSPVLEAMFISFKTMIDRWKEIALANSENWKKWWRPKKTKKTETKAKQNLTESETKANESKIENIKIKKENKKEISLSKDNEAEAIEYGNLEVNECLEIIKRYNNWIVDWTVKIQRNFSSHLIRKLKDIEWVKNWNYTRQQTLQIILEIISQNKFYAWKITSPKSIYDNLWTLMQVCKQEWRKQSSNEVLTTI